MAKVAKRIQKIREGVDPTKTYGLTEAVSMVKERAVAKFDETIEVAMNLGVDPRHADQMVRGVVNLPNGTGRDVRVAVFARGAKADEAKAAGADIVGAEDLMETIQSGKIEFLPNSLRRLAEMEGENPERPILNRYIRQWEGPGTAGSAKYPLQMISTHSRYSFHSYNDGKDSTINDIEDHRVTVDGYAYWVMRMSAEDAAALAHAARNPAATKPSTRMRVSPKIVGPIWAEEAGQRKRLV